MTVPIARGGVNQVDPKVQSAMEGLNGFTIILGTPLAPQRPTPKTHRIDEGTVSTQFAKDGHDRPKVGERGVRQVLETRPVAGEGGFPSDPPIKANAKKENRDQQEAYLFEKCPIRGAFMTWFNEIVVVAH